MFLNGEFDSKLRLRLRSDGGFRILMMSDLHHAPDTGRECIDNMETLIAKSNPDFVLLGGDNTTGKADMAGFLPLLKDISGPMERRGIPWAHVFGNHDISSDLTKEAQQAEYERLPHCVSRKGDDSLPGCGNWFIPVYDENDAPVFGIWGLDSHQDFATPSAPFEYGGNLINDILMPERLSTGSDDEALTFEQVEWYVITSKRIEAELGRKLPSMMIFHIPLQEFNAVARNPLRTGMRGEYNEKVCASELNAGMFAACLRRGDVKAIFCGHDHNNTFDGVYCGIRLGYDGSVGPHAYGLRKTDPRNDREALRCGRIIDINAGGEITTQLVLAHG